MLVAIEAVLIAGILAGVDHDQRDALDGAHRVGEASAARAALIELRDNGIVAAIGPQVLEREGIDQVGMLCGTAGEVAAVVVVVDIVVAVDDTEERLLAGRRELLAGSDDLVVYLGMADQLAVLGKIAGNEHQIGLVRHDFRQSLVDDRAGILEHLAVGILRDREVLAIRPQALREVMEVGDMGDLDLLGIVGTGPQIGDRHQFETYRLAPAPRQGLRSAPVPLGRAGPQIGACPLFERRQSEVAAYRSRAE